MPRDVLARSARRCGLTLAAVVTMVPLSGCFASPPQVVSLNPNNGSTNVVGDMPITVIFDHPVNRMSVLNRFSIEPGLTGCPIAALVANTIPPSGGACRVNWLEHDTKLVLEHEGAPFAPDTKYTMSLTAGFIDGAGVANSLDHRWDLSTGAAPRLTATSPTDGAQGISIDAPVALTFSTVMSVPATITAVSLSPPVPGTRVVPNSHDGGRFLVLPGALLTPNTDYAITVSASATDEHGLHLANPETVHLHTAALDAAGHALILAGRPAEPPSSLILARLQTQQVGDPVATATIREAPRCQQAACGVLEQGQLLEVYDEAVVSPSATAVAVVIRDQTRRPQSSTLIVQSLIDGTDTVIAEAGQDASWSADGTRLAYSTPDGLRVTRIADRVTTALPPGDPLSAPMVWSADGSTLVLPVTRASGTPAVDLADSSQQVRYALPAVLPPPISHATLSPGGDVLALRRLGDPAVAGTWILHLSGGDSVPKRLAPGLTPVDWIDGSTLIAIADSSRGPTLVRVNIAGGDRTVIATRNPADLSTVTVARSTRQIVYLADVNGLSQAFVANSDGSNATALTMFVPATLRAEAITTGG